MAEHECTLRMRWLAETYRLGVSVSERAQDRPPSRVCPHETAIWVAPEDMETVTPVGGVL